MTADEVAAAVLAFAEELANHRRAATIHVPALDLPEGTDTLELLVGPSSQLLSEPVDDARDLDAREFVEELTTRTRELVSPTTEWEDSFDWEH